MVIKGIETKETDPPSPDLAIPKRIIAGITVRQNIKLISKTIAFKNNRDKFRYWRIYIIVILIAIVCTIYRSATISKCKLFKTCRCYIYTIFLLVPISMQLLVLRFYRYPIYLKDEN